MAIGSQDTVRRTANGLYPPELAIISYGIDKRAPALADHRTIPVRVEVALVQTPGKAVDHEVEGSHALIGADIARKYGEAPEIVHAIAAHHEEEKPDTILAVLVQAADALSGARPGARREMLETYVKRLEDLERIGTSFNGVTSCFAIQAGREIRVMVASEVVSDDQSHVIAKDIARKIEDEMTYPGQIRVNVIRETRATDYAK